MAGSINGASAIISRQYPSAIFIHCVSHILNLSIAQSCTTSVLIRNTMGTLNEVSKFFEYGKRQHKLSEVIDNIRTDFKRKRLKSLCRTRWVERHPALQTFAELFPVIIKSLRDIALKKDTVQWDRKTIADANGLLSAIEKGSFLVALVIRCNILNYIKDFTGMLQQSSIDITRAMGLVEDTRKSHQDVRHRVKEFHGEWMKQALEMAEEAGTSIPTVPRMCGIEKHRENITAATPDEYYGQTITIPLLDHLLMELTSRFNKHAKKATMGLCLVPSVMRKDS